MLRDAFELLGAAILLAAAAYALRNHAKDATRFSLAAGLGTVYLGIDEVFDLHERLGARLYRAGWPDPPIVNHYDDALLLLVAFMGFVAIAAFHGEILRERTFALLFGAGLALFAAAIAWDSRADQTGTATWWIEESLEMAGAVVMMLAFRWRLLSGSRGSLRIPPAAALLSSRAEGEL